MEARHILVLISLIAGFSTAGIIVSELIDFARHQKRKREALKDSVQKSPLAYTLRNGIVFLNPIAKVLSERPFFKEKINSYVKLLTCFGFKTQPYALLSILIFLFLVCLVVGYCITSSIIVGLSIFVCLLLLVGMLAKKKEEERKEKIREAIPEALQTMKTCFFAGYSLSQLFEQLALETKGPLRELFENVVSVMNTGGTFDEALACIKNDTNEPELVFLSAALEIQHKTGSSIQQVLEAARESVCDEIELKRNLRTQTAQAKLSAQIVTIMPFALIVLFSFVSEGFLDPFFASFAGICLLLLALFMQFLGVFLVRKLLKVEVV